MRPGPVLSPFALRSSLFALRARGGLGGLVAMIRQMRRAPGDAPHLSHAPRVFARDTAVAGGRQGRVGDGTPGPVSKSVIVLHAHRSPARSDDGGGGVSGVRGVLSES